MKYLKHIKWIAMAMAFVIALNTSVLAAEARGKSKTYHYVSCMTGEKSSEDSFGDIYKFKLKNNKLTIWGSFTRFTSEKNYYNFKNGKYIPYKKKTFTLSKKVKYYASGGEMNEKLSKKQFKKYLKYNGNGLGFRMVIKNNKIVKIYFES